MLYEWSAVFSKSIYTVDKAVIRVLTNEVKEQLIEKVKQEVDPAFIILFGSFAKDTVREESDIDLAYFSSKQLSPYDRFLLSNELALIGGRDVDLVDIKEIDTVFTMQVFAYGIPIYVEDENEFIRQRMRAFSMYATLNEQRAVILNAIKERGSVFGDE